MELMFFLSALPVILILLFVYKKDKTKEPLFLLLQLFVLGMIACILVFFMSEIVALFFPFLEKPLNKMSVFEIFIYAFVHVALIEEVCKWIMVYSRGYKSKAFIEVYDIIVFAVFVSLGFAFLENLLYIYKSQTISIALVRSISAIPAHACDAIFMGYYLSMAKQWYYKDRKDLENKYIALSIIVPTILHGIYDYCLMSNITILIFLFIIFISFLFKVSLTKLKEVADSNKKVR